MRIYTSIIRDLIQVDYTYKYSITTKENLERIKFMVDRAIAGYFKQDNDGEEIEFED